MLNIGMVLYPGLTQILTALHEMRTWP